MLNRDSEIEICSRFVNCDLVIWTQEVTLVRWTQSSGPLCLWQCFFLKTNTLSSTLPFFFLFWKPIHWSSAVKKWAIFTAELAEEAAIFAFSQIPIKDVIFSRNKIEDWFPRNNNEWWYACNKVCDVKQYQGIWIFNIITHPCIRVIQYVVAITIWGRG